jgi:hypothetical protein
MRVQRGSQQHPLTTASEHGRWHTELAGTTDKRPEAPLVRDEEAPILVPRASLRLYGTGIGT